MGKKDKVSLFVACGSSVEDGTPVFWALDMSSTRLYIQPENMRVDVLFDTLLDFLGVDPGDDVTFKPVMGSRRFEQIVSYIQRRMDKHEAEQDS